MNTRRLFTALLLAAVTAPLAGARDMRREIAARPAYGSGIYYAYPVTRDTLQAVPAGYEPVYISHYGRHGSRNVLRTDIYSGAIGTLMRQKTDGNLTSLGDSLIPVLRRLAADTEGHLGELTQLGQRQHRGIAERMVRRFPALFDGTAPVEAHSSTTPRCIVSMQAFTNRLTALNPALSVKTQASPGEMPVIALDDNGVNGLPQTIGKKEIERQAREAYLELQDSLTAGAATARRIFRDPGKVTDLPAFMRDLYDAAIAVQDADSRPDGTDLLTVFDPEDLYNHWQSFNYRMYMQNANPAAGGGPAPVSAAPLLADIVRRADKALESGKKVDLVFGHDTVLLRLLALMGADGCRGTTTDLEEADSTWVSQDLAPMAGNLQLVFFRNAKGGDILVAPRLNEKPLTFATLRAADGYPAVYRWTDLRRLWLSAAHPASALMNRVDPGSYTRIVFEQTDTPQDFFEISSWQCLPLIRANNAVNVAAGLNWYLKYYANTHLSWNGMTARLPRVLPLPARPERRDTDLRRRYYLNYCTHSYSMAFWDRDRWQREVDWMALHGINMPLAIVGTDVVWRNTLRRLGYSDAEADAFVAGPAFQAWWLMNNLEGWGGPVGRDWYTDRAALQRDILAQMRAWGMEPVLPGYSGMVPHDADTRLGMDVSGKGLWNGFTRPAFLKSTDPQFDRVADIYYDELTRLCGTSRYYSMDPFHEGGSTEGVDLGEAAAIITRAMKRANPRAVWVIQGWNENPRPQLLAGIPKGDAVVLDLASEIKPNWGDPDSPSLTKRADGYDGHDWMFCMVLNFGGNVGLHGRIDNVTGGFRKARASRFAGTLTGIGLTPEGIGNNPVMYELMTELPWRPAAEYTDRDSWLRGYTRARYGKTDVHADKAWKQLAATVYDCPWGNMQQGTTESVFCARPSRKVWQVSSWSRMAPYYRPEDVIGAAKTFARAAANLGDNDNYRYDLVDITRQALAEKGRLTYNDMIAALDRKDPRAFRKSSALFLDLLTAQDSLLSTEPSFSVQTWIDAARALGHDRVQKELLEDNARRIVTTWGPRAASEEGGLRDYAHREWHGLLRGVYLPRWQRWIEEQTRALATGADTAADTDTADTADIDWFAMDDAWVRSRTRYRLNPTAQSVPLALALIRKFLR